MKGAKKTFAFLLTAMLFSTALLACGKTEENEILSSAPEETDAEEISGDDILHTDGEYRVSVTLSGGSGKATITSPCTVIVSGGNATALIEWSSPYYDYMIVGDETYYPVNEDGNSVFEIPVENISEPLSVVADTTAMSTPHEIEYTIEFGDVSLGTEDDAADAEGAADSETKTEETTDSSSDIYAAGDVSSELKYDHSLELLYATNFSVDYYQDGFALITIHSETQYLVVPEGEDAPEDVPDSIIIIKQPLDNIYMAASAVMDMFISLDALENIRFSALDTDGWYLDEAKESMESGDIVYAGKYSAPDYELILSGNCDLAIENTMIFHNPEVKEELESFGITVLVDYSSYESEPAGRMEWIKLYGVLTGKEDEANEAFSEQLGLLEAEGTDSAEEASGKSVAFFYITSAGAVNVRKSSDYLAKMIDLAGGVYVPENLGGDSDSSSSTLSMQMEEFYAAAKDADYIIYNSSIEGEIDSIDDLLSLSPLLENFKAVQDGNVFCTYKNLYQASMRLGTITHDISAMLGGKTDMTYLYKVAK